MRLEKVRGLRNLSIASIRSKALWVIGVILLPYMGVLMYMMSEGKSMAERRVERIQQVRQELRNVIGAA